MLDFIAQYKCKCCGCGCCCINCTPISLDPRDIKRLEKCFSMSRKDVMKQYVKKIDGEMFIRGDQPCMFLSRETLKCDIYEYRPTVCRTHPFLSNAQRNVDCFWIESNCAAMSDFWQDYMKDNHVFAAIMDRTSDPVFMKNSEETMRRLLKKKLDMNNI